MLPALLLLFSSQKACWTGCNDWELETEDPVDVSRPAHLWAAARLAACNLFIVAFVSAFNSLFFFPLSFLRHLDFFEMLRNEDELEFAKRFELVSISIADADAGSWCHGCF